MFFAKRGRSRTRTTKVVNRKKHPRRRSLQDCGLIPGPICCGPTVEELEGRQMLSAAPAQAVAATVPAGLAKTTFVLGSQIDPQFNPAAQQVPGYTPQQVQTAYGITNTSGVNQISFNGIAGNGAGQTVAIVDAFNDPNIKSDAGKFSSFFNLPTFNSGGPTLQVLNETGGTALPPNATPGDWDVEESLDVEWVHSIAPEANIILYEATTANTNDMYEAELTAAANPAVSVVSNSWGTTEYGTQETQDEASYFLTPVNHQGVTFLASTGDHAVPAGFPSFSRDVVAVGGTNLQIQSSGAYLSESAWSETGGGISTVESLPPFQDGIIGSNGASGTFRNVPDVAADADPNTGVAVYDSFAVAGGWLPFPVGGTSLACPIWAGMVAIADQGRVLAGEGTLNGETQTLPMLYNLPSTDFNDVTTGNNGTYFAGPGYDLVTGLGTPKANLLLPALAGYVPQTPLTITAPSVVGVTENLPLVFSQQNDNAISIADSSADTHPDSVTLQVSDGTLTLPSTVGLTFISGSNGLASFEVDGTVSDLNAALSGLVYQPSLNFVGQDSLSELFFKNGAGTSASTTINVVPAVSTQWADMTNALPNDDGGQLALLLPDGQLFVHGGAGSDSSAWYLVTPDSTGGYLNGTWTPAAPMNVGRLYFGSTVLQNGEVFVVGGEYSTDGSDTNTAEIYNPVTNIWTPVKSDPQTNVGDEPTELLPDGDILVGNIANNGTELYNPTSNTWTAGGAKVHATDVSDEEPWVKLANGDILTYDIFSSINDNKFEAELYDPTTNSWSDASTTNGTIPLLSTPEEGYELGPALLLPDGRALFTGANGATAFFNPTNSTWTQGPTMPSVMINGVLTQLTMGDAPGSILPNGDVLLALSPAVNIDSSGNENFPGPTFIYDFNPTANVFTDVSPSATVDPNLGGPLDNSFINTMLVLPTGQVLLSDDGSPLAIYTPNGSPQTAWQPTITSFVNNGNGTYMLTGTQLNGLDEGAAYGDDNQMAENYPIVRVNDTSNGKVYYATTSNWSSVGVATGSTPETVTVVLPALGNDSYTITVIADGIASNPLSITGLAPSIAAPLSVSVNENSSLAFSGGNAISVSDPGGTAEQMTLSVVHGTLNLSNTAGLAVTVNSPGSVTLTGTLIALNSDLPSLTYTPTIAYAGADTLSLTDIDTTDNLTATNSVAITVISLVPVITAPSAVSLNQNTSLAFIGGNAISVSDPNGTAEQMTLSVVHGTLDLSNTAGLTVTVNNPGSVTLTGSLDNLNTDLASLSYTPSVGYNGPDVLSITDTDTADNLTGIASVSITVNPLPPSISAPQAVSVNENSTFAFNGGNAISVSDPSQTAEQLTLTIGQGALSIGTATGLTITGNGTGAMTVTGLLATLDSDLATLTYTPMPGYNGPDTLNLSDKDTTDNLMTTASVSITVIPPPPTISGPSSATVTQNYPFTFVSANGNEINVADLNANGNFDVLTLSVTDGRVTLGTTTGLTVTSGSNGSASFTVSGTIGNLGAGINGLTYQPNLNYTGNDSLALSLVDPSDNRSATSNVALTVVPVSPPAVSSPPSAFVSENATLVFSAANANLISITDNGAGLNADTETLSVSHGTLTLANLTGVTFLAGGNGTASFTVSTAVSNFNAALNGLTYRPTVAFAGSDSLQISVDDTTDNKTTSTSVPLSVIALPPVITAPKAASLSENSSLAFLPANANTISITDDNPVSDSLSLSVSHGILTLASTSGLQFTTGTNGAASFTVTGKVNVLNVALNGLVYQPTAGYSGPDNLAISISDSGDNESASTHVSLSVSVPASPVVVAPATASAVENGSLVFTSGNSNAITLIDAAAGPTTDSLTLSVAHGTFTLATLSGLTFTSGANGTASFVVTGSVASLNAALNGAVYRPSANYVGSDSLSIALANSSDNESGSAIVALTVTGSNAPSITAPTGAVVSENGAIAFSTATSNAIVVADSGPGSNAELLKLTASHGTVALATTSGLTITAGANDSASITVTGSLANLNAALSGLLYEPNASYTGSDTLAISMKDSADNQSASAGVALAVNAGTAPAIKAPPTVFTKANPVLFSNSAIAITDSNAGSSIQELSVATTAGTLKLASTTGITFISGANNSISMLIEGTLANLNAALNGLSLTMSTKSATVILAYVDLGNNQSGTAAISVTESGGAIGTGSGGGTNSDVVSSTPSLPPDSEVQDKGFTAAMTILAE
jgi:hypothetical protein